MQIVSALFVENFEMRQAPGPPGATVEATRLTDTRAELRIRIDWTVSG